MRIAELRTRLDMAQQRLQKSSERQVALEERLQEHLESETLLIAMSARFVNLPAEEIDSEIENAQRIICEYFPFWPLLALADYRRNAGFTSADTSASDSGKPAPTRADDYK